MEFAATTVYPHTVSARGNTVFEISAISKFKKEQFEEIRYIKGKVLGYIEVGNVTNFFGFLSADETLLEYFKNSCRKKQMVAGFFKTCSKNFFGWKSEWPGLEKFCQPYPFVRDPRISN